MLAIDSCTPVVIGNPEARLSVLATSGGGFGGWKLSLGDGCTVFAVLGDVEDALDWLEAHA